MRTDIDYEEGDVIEYVCHSGAPRTVLVDEREDDIKNGRPGFGGKLLDPRTLQPVPGIGDGVWGYDHQIVRLVRKA